LMTELTNLAPDDVVLKVGTGSGYQAAIPAHLARKVCTIEIIPPVGRSRSQNTREPRV
jgi:protein-L-isoaspartate(D-aspartate) O-methyltransferase